ncbi:MAG: CsbD family protein [Candidatus Eisenbacteria bacterium]
MHNDILKAKWKQLRGSVKQSWGDLTDDDLARIDGSWDRLVGRIEEKTGQVRSDIESRLADLVEQFEASTRETETHPAKD